MIRDIREANENVTSNDKEMAILRERFPSCFHADGSFDIVRFSEFLKGKVEITREGYELKFLGKNYARLLSALETETVIVPDEQHNSLSENKNSENIYITGDNIDGLKHLLKSYAGKIKCIYIDPPYNTGSDGFVYKDKFNLTVDELVVKLSIDEEQARRILDLTSRGSASHSAWLMFMYPRLQLARDLLTDDGVIFISIDDNEQSNLKLICDEVFGESNFIATFPWRKRTAKSDVPFGVSQDYEWIMCYAKSSLFFASVVGKERKYYETPDFPGKPWRVHDLTKQTSASERPNSFFTIRNPKNGAEYPASSNRTWAITEETFMNYYRKNQIVFPGDYDFLNIQKPVFRYWKEDDMKKAGDNFGRVAVSTNLPDYIGMSQDGTKEISALFGGKFFPFPKPSALIKFLLDICSKENDIILDFFSGSATTAHAVMQLNAEDGGRRRFIMVQLPEKVKKGSEAEKAGYETIDQIGRERIIRAAKKIKGEHPDTGADLGFKHYRLCDVNPATLDKIDKFEDAGIISDTTVYDDFGADTILTTWLVHDGYGFTAKAEKIDLGGYTAYWCENHLYFINPGISEKAIKRLVDKYNSQGNFNPQNIIVFGYSFGYVDMENLRTNIKILKDSEKNLVVNLDVRY